jgi:hypothetical protein
MPCVSVLLSELCISYVFSLYELCINLYELCISSMFSSVQIFFYLVYLVYELCISCSFPTGKPWLVVLVDEEVALPDPPLWSQLQVRFMLIYYVSEIYVT